MRSWFLYLVLGLSLLLAARPAPAQVFTDPDAAFGQAQATDRPVLLVFSGSDWCAPCIHLEREVLTDSAFLRYADGRVVVLKADFPQRRKLPAPLVAAYEALADAYNPEGAFPKLVIISADRKRFRSLSAVQQTPGTLLEQLKVNGWQFKRALD